MRISTLIFAIRHPRLFRTGMQWNLIGIFPVTVVIGMLFVSCASENSGTDSIIPSQPSRINLVLSSGEAPKSKELTRTSTTIPTDDGTTTTSNEGNMKGNNVCVGLFDDNGNLITLHQYTYTGATEAIDTRTDATKIVVWANVPSGTFAGKYKLSDFYSTTFDLSNTTTLATTADSQLPTNLPMMSGEETLTWSSTNITPPSIQVTRKVARVALTSLNTSITTGDYAGATFTPTEIFMYHASNSITNWSTGSYSGDANGQTSTTAYLGSGTIQSYTSGTSVYYFYVFPHGATTPTRLVVKGTFTPSGGTGVTKYYPITVNHLQTNGAITTTGTSGTDSQIEANTRYDIQLTINGIGVDTPSEDLEPAAVTVESTVSTMSSASMNVTFN